MFPDSVIDSATIQAYLETDYGIHSDAPFTLKVGVANPALAAPHKAHRVESSAFITACNPFSRDFADAANADLQAALNRELHQRSVTFIEGIGQHTSNQWLGEPSLLVLGLSREAAKALGVRHQQNAIIWSGLGLTPCLNCSSCDELSFCYTGWSA